MKKKVIIASSAVIFVIVLAMLLILGRTIKKRMPTKEEVNVYEYFGVSGIESQEGYAEALASGEKVIPIELNRSLTDEKAFYSSGQMYLDYAFVHDTLNKRFYWDSNENILLYATASDLIKVPADSIEYYIGKKKTKKDYKIVLLSGEKAYVALDFVEEFTDVTFEIFDEPKRIVLQNEWGTISKVTAKKNTELRVQGGVKSKIVAKVEKGQAMTLLDQMDNWSKVVTDDGWIGYIRNKYMNAPAEETEDHEYEEEEFYHQTRDYKINMAWHQVTNQAANAYVSSVLQDTKGINVLSPTWFYLNDNEGNIANLASKDYVNYCHENDVEVWALVSNLEDPSVDTIDILTHTSKRENLTNQLIAAAIQNNIDGINVDFEQLGTGTGESFIQFIRELSLKCEDNGIVLSVDNYVSSEYTDFYNREEQAKFGDYVVVMAYDEHYDNTDEGSVASLGYVEQASKDILDENVAPEQVILGMPFYTRAWIETPVQSEEKKDSKKKESSSYELTSEILGMKEAVSRVEANGAKKKWLSDVGQNYAEYQYDGRTYKIWLEDEASLEEKLKVMKKYDFAGAAFWKLGLEYSSVWDMIIKYM